MTNLFKKSLLALAVLSSSAAIAADLRVTNTSDVVAGPVGLSKQNTAVLDVSTVRLILNPSMTYNQDFEIVVSFDAAEMTVAPKAYIIPDADVVGAYPTAAEVAAAAIPANEITRVAQSATSATFRVGSTAVQAGDFVVIQGARHSRSSVIAAGVVNASVLVKSDTGVVTDTAGTGEKLSGFAIVAGDEYWGSSFNTQVRKIDLAEARLKFTTGELAGEDNTNKFIITPRTRLRAGAIYLDDVTTKYAQFSATTDAGVTKYVISGDFSWIKDTNSSVTGIQPKAGTVVVGSGCDADSLVVTASYVEYTCDNSATARSNTADVANQAVTFDINQGNLVAPSALSDSQYFLTTTQNYTVGGKVTPMVIVNNRLAKTLEGNGTRVSVDYMPYGDNISQILYVTNKAAETGAIYVTAYGEDGKKLLDSVKLSENTKSRGITMLSSLVNAELAKVGFKSGKVAFVIDIDSSNATVFSAYNVAGDRLATK